MSKGENQTLFTAFTLGNRQLKNRIVMVPMRLHLGIVASISR